MSPTSLRRIAAVLLSVLVFASAGAGATAADAASQGRLKRIVLLRFKDGIPPSQVEEYERAFLSVPRRVSCKVDLEMGRIKQPSAFTHCNTWTFESAEEEEKFLSDPAHRAVGVRVQPAIAETVILDITVDQGSARPASIRLH